MKKIIEVNGLVRLKDLDDTISIELRYASENNFTGKKIYPIDICVLRRTTAEKLVKVNEEVKKKGYRIKVWDAYRPVYVQQLFWNVLPDDRFVANPAKTGSKHSYGAAVDVTLITNNGEELKMPSSFDDFSIKARRDNPNIEEEVRKNLNYLTETMCKFGFDYIDSEWWHYVDSEWKKYDILDVKLDKFI
ncbi:M15 family metallopeptidase [Clostridium sp. PL3]|uniref:D-alanyl-D-alanine dipeptidase n=1 Tax=Clostridium thailandense TaxID=2794346 RepID=A0A949TFZ3_9CLOT|nr:M15 family metallopeptidase [Clostridium thailandense]MBV7272094.1 M15 family metallopeptidase [Clostridium thailandense]